MVWNVVNQLPIVNKHLDDIIIRGIILNSVSKLYSDIWKYSFNKFTKFYELSKNNEERLPQIKKLTNQWSLKKIYTNSYFRRQLEIEIDVLVALALNLTLDDLVSIFQGEFSVLKQNEDDTWYDTNGNIVFTCSKGLTGVGVDRPVWEQIRNLQAGETYDHTIEKSELYKGKVVTYYAPFDKCDRVEDYKVAWEYFEGVFKD
jgi:hypothetical protein